MIKSYVPTPVPSGQSVPIAILRTAATYQQESRLLKVCGQGLAWMTVASPIAAGRVLRTFLRSQLEDSATKTVDGVTSTAASPGLGG